MREYTDLQRKYISTLVRWMRHPETMAFADGWSDALRTTRSYIYTGYHTERSDVTEEYLGAIMLAARRLEYYHPDIKPRAFGNALVLPSYPYLRYLFNAIRKCPPHTFERVFLDLDATDKAMGKI